ncbi:hypothetical protein ACFVRV_06325 [Arthrobacter koreensis]|uniref:hypothetical protein n=1 Tax=Arthrobacter koreensis TaxID=199136 RepID=UPI0036DCFAFD
MIRAWFRALLRRGRTDPSPLNSLPHHSDAEAWSEEAFYGTADHLYGHNTPTGS